MARLMKKEVFRAAELRNPIIATAWNLAPCGHSAWASADAALARPSEPDAAVNTAAVVIPSATVTRSKVQRW